MNEPLQNQEQHPLLCDECSEEELYIRDASPKFHRRLRHPLSSGRAKTHATGAAAIIASWPDDISSLLQYWWIALGMFAFMVFLIYNCVAAVPVLTYPNNNRLKNIQLNYTTENKSNNNPSVYMHLFFTNYEEYNSNDYIPHIQTIISKYPNFRYNLYIVINDSVHDSVSDSINYDEQINSLALNSLWNNNEIIREKYENFIVKQISLSVYMDDSPLKKYWRLVPPHFIGFLSRCLAVWDKGGIAINPMILSPKTPNLIYLEKLHNILENFQSKPKLMSAQKQTILKKPKKNLDNIRDIIIDLEKGENMNEYLFTNSDLDGAENIANSAVTLFKFKRNSNTNSFDESGSKEFVEKQKNKIWHKNNSEIKNRTKINTLITLNKGKNNTKISDIAAAQNILPKFLEYFFQLSSKNLTSVSQNYTEHTKLTEKINLKKTLNNDTTFKTNPNSFKIKSKSAYKSPSVHESTKLIVDLKGNLIATEVACHAFIGTVLSKVLHFTDYQSVTDYIIQELSLFCKGSLSSCNNVDVILL